MPSDPDAQAFLAALAHDLPAEERLIICGFSGDPGVVGPTQWRPRPWAPGRDLPLERDWNGYVTVSSFRRAGDGSFRRRAETFAAGRALMVDDVGTKVDRAAVAALRPSAIVETSPSNEQWWYFLRTTEPDGARFDGVIRAFISGKLLGHDPGMSGITRVGRVPGYVNGKPQHKGWRCRLLELNQRQFTVEELLIVFGLHINDQREVQRAPPPVLADALERNAAFAVAYKWMERRGLMKRATPDMSGWTEIHCPWRDGHTGHADTGAAVREPASENDYWGAFRCHHGSCADRGWADLTAWIAEEAAEELENAARLDHG